MAPKTLTLPQGRWQTKNSMTILCHNALFHGMPKPVYPDMISSNAQLAAFKQNAFLEMDNL